MADNYLQFSEVLPALTEQEEAWLKQQLEFVYVVGDREYTSDSLPTGLALDAITWEGCRGLRPRGESDDAFTGFDFDFRDNKTWGRHLWLYADDSGHPAQAAYLVQQFLRRFRPDQCWSLTYGTTCSKPRIGEFGGGAVFVTAESIESFEVGDFLEQQRAAFQARPK